MNDRCAAVVAGGSKAGHVGHYSATDGHHDIGAVHVGTRHVPTQLLDGRQRLGPLAAWDRQHLIGQAGVDLDSDAALGHDRRTAGSDRHETRNLGPYALTHQHVVAALAELDPHADRRAANPVRSSQGGLARSTLHDDACWVTTMLRISAPRAVAGWRSQSLPRRPVDCGSRPVRQR